VADMVIALEIHVGTDSQNHKNKTVYSTVIAYRHGNRGVHYIYNIFKVNKIKDKWTRLWNEAEMSILTAEWVSKKIKVQIEIDFDYNENEQFFSSKLINPATGWAKSLGYKVNVKPNNIIACKASDKECR
jgi:predicted RNase H-related nuclease YkuK (DUF458 family)